MYNARQAKDAAIANKFKKKILNDIESAIQAAVLDGETECKVPIDPETPKNIVDDILMTMEEAGYWINSYTISANEKFFRIDWEEAE